jgi:hypothetical protein
MPPGIEVAAVRDVVTLRLRHDVPGQLGELTRRMADAGVNIEAQYSDHDHRLVLVVDDEDAAGEVARRWDEEWWGHGLSQAAAPSTDSAGSAAAGRLAVSRTTPTGPSLPKSLGSDRRITFFHAEPTCRGSEPVV